MTRPGREVVRTTSSAFSVTTVTAGGGASAVDAATQLGGLVGSRTFSKDYELEADRLGTVITARAGYNPLVGARFFTRIPDPGNQFLGTHPPNAQREEVVRQTARAIGFGG